MVLIHSVPVCHVHKQIKLVLSVCFWLVGLFVCQKKAMQAHYGICIFMSKPQAWDKQECDILFSIFSE